MPTRLLRHTTSGVAEQFSLTAWERFLHEIYYGHLIGTDRNKPISGSIEARYFADVGITRHRATAHTISRTASLIASDKAEKHAFVFPRQGLFKCGQSGREIHVRKGGLYVLNASEPFEVETSNLASSYSVVIPSDVARLVFKDIDDRTCRPQMGEGALVSAIKGFVSGVLRHDTKAEDSWLRDTICDLIEFAISPRFRTSDDGWTATDAARHLLVDSARRIIRDNLHDPNFSVSDAAMTCRVSVRLLQSAFQRIGSTFRDELWEARLQHASELLRSPARGMKRVGQIAQECGFLSQAHFSTSYKARFGLSPKDERPV